MRQFVFDFFVVGLSALYCQPGRAAGSTHDNFELTKLDLEIAEFSNSRRLKTAKGLRRKTHPRKRRNPQRRKRKR